MVDNIYQQFLIIELSKKITTDLCFSMLMVT